MAETDRSLNALGRYQHLSNPDHYLGYVDNQVAYVLPDDGYLGISSPAFSSRKTDYTRMKSVSPHFRFPATPVRSELSRARGVAADCLQHLADPGRSGDPVSAAPVALLYRPCCLRCHF